MTSYLDGRRVSPPSEFYGSSSTAKLLHQANGSLDRSPGELKRTPGSMGGPSPGVDLSKGNSCISASMESEHLENLALPTRDLADMLLDVYWSKVHPFAPMVYKPAFAAALEGLWKPRKELHNSLGDADLGLGSYGVADSRTTLFHCALNAIFAWSCYNATPALAREERESLAQRFFLRSKKLLGIHILDHGSVAHVQTLLLVAQCLQNSSLFPTQSWNMLGLACRIGQGIGLHVEKAPVQRSRRELEVRRRVWYACQIMDT
jgi:Fungal specific transcription factor domain